MKTMMKNSEVDRNIVNQFMTSTLKLLIIIFTKYYFIDYCIAIIFIFIYNFKLF